jgi:hypothetical protein
LKRVQSFKAYNLPTSKAIGNEKDLGVMSYRILNSMRKTKTKNLKKYSGECPNLSSPNLAGRSLLKYEV